MLTVTGPLALTRPQSISRFTGALTSVVASAAAFYSVRIPSGSSYTGPLIRARRSSDNAEQDIYAASRADAAGDRWLDTAALASFAGGGSAFVTAWYDHVAARHATQATAANQPRIVDAGVIDLLDNRPSLVWTSAGTIELKTTVPFTTYPATLNVVCSIQSSSASKGTFMSLGDDDGPGICVGDTAAGSNFGTRIVALKGGVAWMPTSASFTVGKQHTVIYTALSGGASSLVYGDGAQASINAGATSSPRTPSGSLWIGGHPLAGTKLRGASISEVVCFANTLPTRVDVERSQGRAFGMTVA